MKYLIISDAGSMHVYNFIKEMLSGRGYDIYILTHSVGEIPQEYLNYYKENNVTVYSLRYEGHKNLYSRNKLNVAIKFLKKYFFMRKLGKIDVCHIHYVHNASLLLTKLFKKRINKLIFSYWGDDVLIPKPKEIEMQKKMLPFSNAITVTVKNSYNVFRERFGNIYDDRLQVLHFATDGVRKIKEVAEKYSKVECRKQFNVPDGKLLLVCGYNADPAQRQDEIAEQIAKLDIEIKEKLHIIVPLQYGRKSEEYIERVKMAFKNCGCSHNFFEEYVPFERNAIMSLATDIYLNLRASDAFSNAMKEHICAGSYMITGSWLKYIELDEMQAPVTKIDSFDELPQVITDLVNNHNFSMENNVFELMYNMFAREQIRKEWDSFFERLGK